ncbi:MAG: YCF48-related protein [Pirellulaceae bacterium]
MTVLRFTNSSSCRWLPVLLVSALATLGVQSLLMAARPQVSSPEMLEDAELTDVTFVDPDRGWAVGDRGVIWQTVDGGRHWTLHASRVDCRLESVQFIDGQYGWIAGGRTGPYSQQSEGVLLYTADGGRRWTRIPIPTLPALREIRFFDRRHGWAVGASSGMYPAGIFRTRDGGRTWSPVPSGRVAGWQTGDFHDHQEGVVAGSRGQVSWVTANQLKPTANPPWGKRVLRSLRLASPTDGWLIGDQGLVLVSRDGGLHWQKPAGALPRPVEEQFDFRALALAGKHCWIAGAPGSRVLHSEDGGKTWDVFSTPQSLPVEALTFLDSQRGWAVGALGTIMATRDGGKTWRVQRRGGERVAILGIYSQSKQVPWESFARFAGNQGYLSVVHVLDQAEAVMGRAAVQDQEQRLAEAVTSIGGSSSGLVGFFTFPHPELKLTAQQIARQWDRSSERPSWQILEEQLVRRIRQWRPEVVLTEAASTGGEQPAAQLTHQLVLRAVELAADRTIFPEQISVAGLQPWSVKKVVSTLPAGVRGSVNVPHDQLATRLGLSLSDCAFVARGLISDRYQQTATSQGFRFSINRLPQELGTTGVMSGIRLTPGGTARRLLTAAQVTNLERLTHLAQKRRKVAQLLSHEASPLERSGSWLAQIQDLTRGLETQQIAEVLYQLGHQYHESGQPQLAVEVFRRLVRDCPGHDLTPAAYLYLIQCYASGEVAWQQRVQHQPVVRQGQSRSAADQKKELLKQQDRAAAGDKNPATPGQPGIVNRSPESPADIVSLGRDSAQQDNWLAQAIDVGKQLQRLYPQIYSEPTVRFPLATTARKRGLTRDADRLYHLLMTQAADQNWGICAQTEVWLTHRRNVPPKPTVICPQATEKPFLDGRLDDTCWQAARPARLVTDVADDNPWPAEVMFSGDDQFLYLAVRCRKAAAATYRQVVQPRSRDADLSRHDRVDVWLDIDRDYQTYYRLTVDYRGGTAEACWGDRSWNPDWFVATAEDEQYWIVEAAIAWNQLAGNRPGPQDAWAVAVQRVIPGVGFQSWTQPASVAAPGERCGLLLFR